MLAAEERAVEVDRENLPPCGEIGLLDIAERGKAGGVDQAIEPVVAARDLADDAEPIVLGRNVKHMAGAVTPGEIAGDGYAARGFDRRRHRAAERTRRTGDQNKLVLEPLHAASIMLVLGIVRMAVVVVVMMVVAVTMVMVVMIVTVVVVMMLVAVRRRGIGASLRLERRLDGDDLGAEAFEQSLDRRVALEPQPAFQHLHRNMAVAEMPGEPRQTGQIGGSRLDQRLGLGHDLDQLAVVQQKRVIGAKAYRLGEIELDAGALDAEQKALLRRTLRVGQDQRVDDGLVAPFCRSENASGAWHVC